MTFISYAQNFEDIRLWRALKTVENGFYIDVGANDPTHDSVTKAFYDHGWSGINVEPMPNYYEALCQQRPKDTNLQCVAGESADSLTFYGIAGTGLSTVDPAMAQMHKDAGMDVRSQTVQSRTLTSICEEHAQGRPIHFLKIDVEGHEETVLRGMDFTRWRPWVILIETPWDRDQTWETLVTGAGYHSILFDGINTYYLAEEHLNLKPAFDIPPCNLDEFQFCKGHNFSHPIGDAEQQLATALQRAEQAEAQLRAMQNSRTWQAIQKLKKTLLRA
ncbi:FkbM family methyltransferase [Pseudomonas sp. URMO17WK12:I12]|uniref:FkbM family methyltransferase n=1 Tax=unclassified Pseudomonas TaxID=196821 RepID=UPI0004870439|nr:FkbM family methyltransferase [Pseudomonas sp. URMO17WK12:I12]